MSTGPQVFKQCLGYFIIGDSMNTQELIEKFNLLKNKHTELTSEKLRCEAKRDQLISEIKSIQEKYPEYDLSTAESVEKTIATTTNELNKLLASIEEQYAQIKAS